ncbi:hypothetical protein MBLNU457_5587t1 [Dothideomycetes sp. NU457]
MTTKHFFSDTAGVVALGLESVVARNSHLALDAPNKVVYQKSHSLSKVSVISGGGAGHEPAWAGYVGDGMLAAAVSGEVFASPATRQIMAAIEHAPSDAGIVLCITNYTGDNLHFGLAREKATGMGYKVGMLRMSEDVGLGRKQTQNTGRRGLAGNVFVLKLCGSASEKGYAFEEIMKIGQAVNDNCGTIGSALDFCHIPGRAHEEHYPPDTFSIAQGIHNEPGLIEVSPIPPADKLVSDLLKYLLDPSDQDRAFVKYSSSDDIVLLINNFGGMSNLELEALTTITMRVLSKEWNITPKRNFVSCFETSLNAPGWSISLLNLSGISQETSIAVDELYALLDLETTAPAWPRNGYARTAAATDTTSTKSKASAAASVPGPTVSPATLDKAIRTACKAVIAAEPDITKWDIQTGDGDCGEAVEAICQGILKNLDDGLCETHNGALFPILDQIGEAVEDVGGTLGAIIAIFLASFLSSLRAEFQKSKFEMSTDAAAAAASEALGNLKTYTGARVGGRTVMDTLIPFVEALETSKDFGKAAKAAEDGARSTEGMSAKFGRASYMGEGKGEAKAIPMDPGAWAAAVFIKGLAEGLGM